MFMGPTAHAQFAQSAQVASPRPALRSSVGLPVLLLAAGATLPWVLVRAIVGTVTRSIGATPGR